MVVINSIMLPHWGRVMHICIGNLTIIGSDNGLSPNRRQAITWNNVEILLFGPLGTNFNEFLIKIRIFSFKKMHLKMSVKRWPFCLGLNVLNMLVKRYSECCSNAGWFPYGRPGLIYLQPVYIRIADNDTDITHNEVLTHYFEWTISMIDP